MSKLSFLCGKITGWAARKPRPVHLLVIPPLAILEALKRLFPTSPLQDAMAFTLGTGQTIQTSHPLYPFEVDISISPKKVEVTLFYEAETQLLHAVYQNDTYFLTTHEDENVAWLCAQIAAAPLKINQNDLRTQSHINALNLYIEQGLL